MSTNSREGIAQAYGLEEGIKEIKIRIEKLLKGKEQVLVGIAGGTASGKSFLAERFKGEIILIDDYCRGAIKGKNTNFDEPATYDLKLLAKHLKLLRKGKEINVPVYDMVSRSRKGFKKFAPSRIIIVDGLYALNPSLKRFIDLKVYVESPEDKRFRRRMERDVRKGIWSDAELKEYYSAVVKPMHEQYVEPTKSEAEIIINNS